MLFDINCLACKLGRGRTVPGSGSVSAETRERIPLIGKSGQLLRRGLKSIVGLNPEEDVFYTNIIKCEPAGQTVTEREIQACKSWLNKELGKVTSKVILIAGSQAKKALLPQVEEDVSKIHGQVFQDQLRGFKMLVTWNPAYVDQFSAFDEKGNRLIQTGSVPWMFMNDLKKLKELLDGN
jgi:uracil-DNA glycosylase family 4